MRFIVYLAIAYSLSIGTTKAREILSCEAEMQLEGQSGKQKISVEIALPDYDDVQTLVTLDKNDKVQKIVGRVWPGLIEIDKGLGKPTAHDFFATQLLSEDHNNFLFGFFIDYHYPKMVRISLSIDGESLEIDMWDSWPPGLDDVWRGKCE